jgi:tetratricopeptide (TPR) repeat protein
MLALSFTGFDPQRTSPSGRGKPANGAPFLLEGNMAMVVGLRRFGRDLFCAVGMFFAGMLFAAPPAAADDYDVCAKESGDIAIAACSRAIASGRYKNVYILAFLHVNRGIEYTNKGQHDRAIEDYDETIRLTPQNAAALFNRGLSKRATGDAAGGDVDIARARQLEPGIGQ